LLKEDGAPFSLPMEAFVFFMHQGYQFMFFLADGAEDPEVWYYHEGDGVPALRYPSFSSLLFDYVYEGWMLG
jgi:hypothetical protein